MRRAILLALAGASIVVAVLAIAAGERARPRSAGSPATPATRSGPAERPAGRCRQIPLPVSPDRPHALAADRHSLWVVGELTLYRYDLATPHRLTARVPLPGLALVLARSMLWAANLTEGPTFVYGIDARSGTVRSKRRGDTEIVAMAAGSGAVWAGEPRPSHAAAHRSPQRPHHALLPHIRPPARCRAAGNHAWVATTEPNEVVSFSAAAAP